MNLRGDTDQTPFQAGHIQHFIHPRAEAVSEPDMSLVILFIPTDMLQQLCEIPDGESSIFVSDVLAASIVHQMRGAQKRFPLSFDGFIIDPATRKVQVRKKSVPLPRREFDLLWFFARHPRCVFTRSQLLDYVWGRDYMGTENTVTVHIRRLRQKIEPDPDQPVYFRTIWGVGYMFDPS